MTNKFVFWMLAVLCFAFFGGQLSAQAKAQAKAQANLELEEVFSTDGVVWGFDFLNSQELLITTRDGKLLWFNQKTKSKKPLVAPKSLQYGQGGLLDVKVYRRKGQAPYVFLTFSEKVKNNITTSLARGEWRDGNLTGLKTIFRAIVRSTTGRHFGSRLAFKGKSIFMTVGDRGERKYAQDNSLHNGTVLRLTLDGRPHPENPFISKANARAEIYSTGHRNPQGIDFDPVSGDLYSVEFGPRGGDELNKVEAGKNYGWPVITYGREYYGPKIGDTHKEGMEQPVAYWVPSISPSGMVFYRGDKLPGMKNNLFVANLSARHLRRLVLENGRVTNQEELFKDKRERFRHVENGPDGYLYTSTDSGKLFRIESTK